MRSRQLKTFAKKTLNVIQGYNPKTLKLWERSSNYIGPDYSDYFPLVGYTRDSGPLEKSNFEAMRDELSNKEGDLFKGVEIMGFSHWGCGWFDLIMIHKNARPELLKHADIMMESLEDYPILDDSHYCDAIREEIQSVYDGLGSFEFNELVKFLNIADSFNDLSEEMQSAIESFAYYMVEASEYYYGSDEIWLYCKNEMLEEAKNIIEDNGIEWKSEELRDAVNRKIAA